MHNCPSLNRIKLSSWLPASVDCLDHLARCLPRTVSAERPIFLQRWQKALTISSRPAHCSFFRLAVIYLNSIFLWLPFIFLFLLLKSYIFNDCTVKPIKFTSSLAVHSLQRMLCQAGGWCAGTKLMGGSKAISTILWPFKCFVCSLA